MGRWLRMYCDVLHSSFLSCCHNQIYDPLIRITIEKYSYPVGMPALNNQALQLQLFPNPCSGRVNLVYSIPENRASNVFVIFDVRGKEIKEINPGAGAGMHQLS